MSVIRNEAQYDQAVEHLNNLIDEIGTDETHPLYELLDTLGTLGHAYEEQHHPVPDCSGREMVGFLMEEHGLKQADLPEIGSQGIVSEVLSGKRELNVRQIRALAKRFPRLARCVHLSRNVQPAIPRNHELGFGRCKA